MTRAYRLNDFEYMVELAHREGGLSGLSEDLLQMTDRPFVVTSRSTYARDRAIKRYAFLHSCSLRGYRGQFRQVARGVSFLFPHEDSSQDTVVIERKHRKIACCYPVSRLIDGIGETEDILFEYALEHPGSFSLDLTHEEAYRRELLGENAVRFYYESLKWHSKNQRLWRRRPPSHLVIIENPLCKEPSESGSNLLCTPCSIVLKRRGPLVKCLRNYDGIRLPSSDLFEPVVRVRTLHRMNEGLKKIFEADIGRGVGIVEFVGLEGCLGESKIKLGGTKIGIESVY